MGNSISTPESMKNIPSELNEDEYLQMTYDGTNYCIQKRANLNRLSASIRQNFTAEAFLLDAVGLGQFRNINKQKTGQFYVTLNNPLNEPVPTTVDSTRLSWFIKGFAYEQGIQLENATFQLKTLTKKEEKKIENKVEKEQQKEIEEMKKELSSFGKSRSSFGKRKNKLNSFHKNNITFLKSLKF
jgi:hypothetical protein